MLRALGRRGLRVAAGAGGTRCSGMHSRYAAARLVVPDPRADLDQYAAVILEWLREHPTDVVLTSTDAGLETLHHHRERFAAVTSPAVGAPEAVDIAASKARTLEVAAELGIPAPRSISVSCPDSTLAALAEIGLPAVIKPFESWRQRPDGRGERVSPVLVETLDGARTAAHQLVRPDGPALVQEVAPGGRETHKLFVSEGKVVASLVMRPERCWPPLGGSSTMRRTIEPPADTAAMAERLVTHIGLEGYSEVEFRRTACGQPRLMEINARLSQSIELADAAGVDFAYLQLEWARGRRLPAMPRPRHARVGWLAGDLRVMAGSLVGSPPPRPCALQSLRAIGGDYLARGARIEGIARDDLRPTVRSLHFTARVALNAVRRRLPAVTAAAGAAELAASLSGVGLGLG